MGVLYSFYTLCNLLGCLTGEVYSLFSLSVIFFFFFFSFFWYILLVLFVDLIFLQSNEVAFKVYKSLIYVVAILRLIYLIRLGLFLTVIFLPPTLSSCPAANLDMVP